MLKVYPVSLGCPKNRVDFEKTLYQLQHRGYELTLNPAEADLLWVNTCAFIRPAVEEAIETILELSEYKKKGAKLYVAGCLTARYGEETLRNLLPEVDEFLGIEAFKELYSLEPLERTLTGNPFYAYLKISEGCPHRCSYCTIPKIRGPYRSRPLEELLQEAEILLKGGVKEIILVGQDTSLYGRDLSIKDGLLRLVEKISRLPYEFRLRILYLHPQQIDEGLLMNLLSLPKVLPYFEIPIQHAHPAILKAMRRLYSPEKILNLLQKVRTINPQSAFRSTVMVGFPGEKEREFSFLLEFLKEAKFDYLGAFIFFPEEGTEAAKCKGLPSVKERKRRRREVLTLQQEITANNLKKRIGLPDEVLILEIGKSIAKGIASFQAPEIDGITFVKDNLKDQRGPLPGNLVKVRITEAKTYDLVAKLDNSP